MKLTSFHDSINQRQVFQIELSDREISTLPIELFTFPTEIGAVPLLTHLALVAEFIRAKNEQLEEQKMVDLLREDESDYVDRIDTTHDLDEEQIEKPDFDAREDDDDDFEVDELDEEDEENETDDDDETEAEIEEAAEKDEAESRPDETETTTDDDDHLDEVE